MKLGLHESQLKLYAEEKSKFETITKLNNAPIVQQLNGNSRRTYTNLRMA